MESDTVNGKCARIVEVAFLANLTCYVLFASHDRTMQDIVYKLVPGLQEGKCQNVHLDP